MFETLNVETDPEYAGFTASCEALYPATAYRSEALRAGGEVGGSLCEHLYDETLSELDVDKCLSFFCWL
jgi:hypothetical protein